MDEEQVERADTAKLSERDIGFIKAWLRAPGAEADLAFFASLSDSEFLRVVASDGGENVLSRIVGRLGRLLDAEEHVRILLAENARMREALAAIREHVAPQPSALAAAIVATIDGAIAAMSAGEMGEG